MFVSWRERSGFSWQCYHDINLIVASSVSWQKSLKEVCDCCPDGLMVRGSLSHWKRIVFHESVVRLDGKWSKLARGVSEIYQICMFWVELGGLLPEICPSCNVRTHRGWQICPPATQTNRSELDWGLAPVGLCDMLTVAYWWWALQMKENQLITVFSSCSMSALPANQSIAAVLSSGISTQP